MNGQKDRNSAGNTLIAWVATQTGRYGARIVLFTVVLVVVYGMVLVGLVACDDGVARRLTDLVRALHEGR